MVDSRFITAMASVYDCTDIGKVIAIGVASATMRGGSVALA